MKSTPPPQIAGPFENSPVDIFEKCFWGPGRRFRMVLEEVHGSELTLVSYLLIKVGESTVNLFEYHLIFIQKCSKPDGI